MPGTAQEILTILVADKRLSQKDADVVTTESLSSGESVEVILKRKRMVSDADIARAKAKSLGIPFVTLTGRAISSDTISFIPEPVIRRYSLIPFQFDTNTNELSIAMVDPLDFQVIEFLEQKSGKRVRAYMALKDDIAAAIDVAYTQNIGENVSAAVYQDGGV